MHRLVWHPLSFLLLYLVTPWAVWAILKGTHMPPPFAHLLSVGSLYVGTAFLALGIASGLIIKNGSTYSKVARMVGLGLCALMLVFKLYGLLRVLSVRS
jgi:hypothetical protein